MALKILLEEFRHTMKFMGYVSIPVYGEEILRRADVEQFGISMLAIFPCFGQTVFWRSCRFMIGNWIGSCLMLYHL